MVDIFWQTFDPTDCVDRSRPRLLQYESAIFYHDAEQKKLAEDSKKYLISLGRSKKPIETPVSKYSNFYAAEEYHQKTIIRKKPKGIYGLPHWIRQRLLSSRLMAGA